MVRLKHLKQDRKKIPSKQPLRQEKKIIVNLIKQCLIAYNGDKEYLNLLCISGDAKHPTPTGKFKVLGKEEKHWSQTYKAQMNFALRLTTDGIFIHESYNLINEPSKQNMVATIISDSTAGVVSVGRKLFPKLSESNINVGNINLLGSHGCIRLSHSGAAKLFEWADIGIAVEII